MAKNKILLIGGSLNQTTMMHMISEHLSDYDCYFSPYYTDGILDKFAQKGMLGFTILGGNFKKQTEEYFHDHNLKMDYKGLHNNYDLIFTCSDLMVQKNIIGKKIVLVQEGMTDPEKLGYYLVKYLNFPRWMASTSVTGISNYYDKFCVASEGYRKLFIQKGVNPEKIEVTGIPNFDNCKQFLNNDFPHHGYVLVATSDMRETYKYENRKKFIQRAYRIANGKQLIFKLHPNENYDRAAEEINKYAPGSLVFHHEPIEPIIANCDILVTRFSTVVYIGLALDKEVYSEFDIEQLKELVPIQNGGTSAFHIAQIGRRLLAETESSKVYTVRKNSVKHIPLKEKLRFRRKLAKIKH